MTVTTTDSRDVKQGDGNTTDFPTSFQFFSEDELEVTLVLADGSFSPQTLNTDYTVTGGEGNPGTVKMTSAPAANEQLVITRQTFRVQNLDLVANDFLPAEALEDVADRLVLMVQELGDVVERAPRIQPNFTGAPPRLDAPASGKLLTWDANGNLVNTDLGEIDTQDGTVTTFGENLVGQAGAQGARQLLELDDHTKNSVDASQLGGNDPSFYTNITARLGYTPADKAGDIFTGAVTVVSDSSPILFARPSSPASDDQGVQLRQSNAGLATVQADAGSSGLGDLVLQSATIPQHDDGNQLRRLLTVDDLTGWQPVASGDFPSGVASFDISLPSGYRRFKIMVFEAEINDPEVPRARLSSDGGNSFFDGSGDYKIQLDSWFNGADNHDQTFNDKADLVDGFRAGFGADNNSTIDGDIQIFNARRGDKHTRIRSNLTMFLTTDEIGEHLTNTILLETTDETDMIRLIAGGSTTWRDGTWQLWGIAE